MADPTGNYRTVTEFTVAGNYRLAGLGLGKAPGPTGPPSFTNQGDQDIVFDTPAGLRVVRPGETVTAPFEGRIVAPPPA